MRTTLAYCFASGHIEFGHRCPSGALPMARGPERTVRELIEGNCRHGYDGVTLLVPGVPEAPDQSAGVAALERFLDWLRPSAKKSNIRVF